MTVSAVVALVSEKWGPVGWERPASHDIDWMETESNSTDESHLSG